MSMYQCIPLLCSQWSGKFQEFDLIECLCEIDLHWNKAFTATVLFFKTSYVAFTVIVLRIHFILGMSTNTDSGDEYSKCDFHSFSTIISYFPPRHLHHETQNFLHLSQLHIFLLYCVCLGSIHHFQRYLILIAFTASQVAQP